MASSLYQNYLIVSATSYDRDTSEWKPWARICWRSDKKQHLYQFRFNDQIFKSAEVAEEFSLNAAKQWIDAARIAKDATTTIPVVFTVSADPVGEGLVQSLARPGANVTGLSDLHGEMLGKRLELLKEVVPSASVIAFLWNSNSTAGRLQLKELQAAGRALRVTVLSVPVTGPNDIDRAFAQLRKEHPGGLVIHGTPLLGSGTKIEEHVTKSRIPHIFTTSTNVEAGGLMSYGANHHELWRRAAIYVDKILKGAKPADIPVEQPTKFELVINLKTAKQIGITIPPNVLARADRVIK